MSGELEFELSDFVKVTPKSNPKDVFYNSIHTLTFTSMSSTGNGVTKFGIIHPRTKNLEYYDPEELKYLPNGIYDIKCECGSDTIGHPGHTDYCEKQYL